MKLGSQMSFQPIVNHTFTESGDRRLSITADPFAFIVNTVALGDAIAAAPAIRYLIENFYTKPSSYVVVAKQYFRVLFPFVPDESFRDFDNKENNWNIPPDFAIGVLNKKSDGRIIRNTPKSMHLSQFAGILLGDRIIPLSELNYVPLEDVSVDHFNVDFSRSVVLVTSYRDKTRAWLAEHILAVAAWLRKRGLIPVFVGRTEMDAHLERDELIPKTTLPADASEHGVDLRNKTSLLELAAIFRRTKAVCGVDSGPIHLAGTTDVPIICGYTSVSPEHRIPIRPRGKTYAIVPNIECIGCESRWRSNYWNFESCYLGHADCVKHLTADRYISILEKIL